MNNTNKSLLNYVAGVLSIIFSVLGIIWTFCFVQDAKLMYGISLDYFFYYFGVSFVCYLLALLSLLMIAILLFKGVRNTLLSVTVGLEALLKIVMYIDGKNRGDFYLNGSFFGIILLVFAYVGAAIYTYLIFSKKPISQKIKMFWFVPALLSGLSWVIGFFPYGCFFLIFSHNLFISIASEVLVILTLLISLYWIAYPEKSTAMRASPDGQIGKAGSVYISMTKHVLLLLFTFGIWVIIWHCRTTKYTNSIPNAVYRNPIKKLILCIFIPFYGLYWTYKTSQAIDGYAPKKGITSNITSLCLILGFFIPFVPPIVIQDKINAIETAADVMPVADSADQSAQYGTSVASAADEIKKYKELFDSGVITQEEFDTKKAALLGL